MSEAREGTEAGGTGGAAARVDAEALAQALCRRYAALGARDSEVLSDATLQDLIALVVRSYAQRMEAVETDEGLAPFRPEHVVTATQVVVFVMELLRTAEVEVFELGMWQAFGKA